MKKIISLFKRDYEGTKLVYNEIVPGAEWVIRGEGKATIKFDGTACMVKDGKLYKRYDRKLKKGSDVTIDDYKDAPDSWIPCEEKPDPNTHHWPGWLPIGDGPEDKWYREVDIGGLPEGTYELVGPKFQGNPYKKDKHILIPHGKQKCPDAPRTFDGLKEFFKVNEIEGIVWHHPDGRMVKIKRRDFGYQWPV